MKTVITMEQIAITAETAEERKLIHNAKYRRIDYMQLIDIGRPTEHLVLTLGSDYIGDQRSSPK